MVAVCQLFISLFQHWTICQIPSVKINRIFFFYCLQIQNCTRISVSVCVEVKNCYADCEIEYSIQNHSYKPPSQNLTGIPAGWRDDKKKPNLPLCFFSFVVLYIV